MIIDLKIIQLNKKMQKDMINSNENRSQHEYYFNS